MNQATRWLQAYPECLLLIRRLCAESYRLIVPVMPTVLCCAADMLHDFMSSVQSAQSKLSAMCSCVEEYVEKMLFLEQYMAGEKALDAACNQVGSHHTHHA